MRLGNAKFENKVFHLSLPSSFTIFALKILQQMRKLLTSLFAAAVTLSLPTSCIQDEAANTECDILTCTLPTEILVSTPQPTNTEVIIHIRSEIDISKLAPEFTLTPGATINPASGSTQDFLNAEDHTVIYTVTSQDGQWKKDYRVIVSQTETPSDYFFNKTELDASTGKYPIFREMRSNDGELLMTWASGNPGFVMCGMADRDAREAYGDSYKDHIWEFFPTRAVYPEGTTLREDNNLLCFMSGGEYAAPDYIQLATRSTGSFGKMVGMPIAAGNIFQGYFDLANAITSPRSATKFGTPYRYRPMTLSGEYRYKAGDTFTDEQGNVVAGRKDIFSVYAIFFESDANTEYIDSNIHYNDFKHANMVALANLTDARETDEWTQFSVPFDYSAYDREIDPDKLAQSKYRIGIVIASSAEGDYFRGAVGSTLDIRNLKITNQKAEETEQ